MANRLDGKIGFPDAVGLYDPAQERDACGVGFVANIKGVASHGILEDAYHVNSRMDHRGGCGFEENTGDGAGILTAIPDTFFRKIAGALAFELPEAGRYSVGNLFLPTDEPLRISCQQTIEQVVTAEGLTFLGWRAVPIAPKTANIGPAAQAAMPFIAQLFIASPTSDSEADFARKLYIARKQFSARLQPLVPDDQLVYACSLSPRVIVYKGMLTPGQLFPFYKDLTNGDYETHLAMVHSRFSTNTFPSWDRAQPNRFMSHNGEINTLRGNQNWMTARQGAVSSPLFGDNIEKIFPLVEPDCSDSGTFDNVLEFLLLSGRSLQESVMMMIPEAWQADVNMSAEKRAFYEYHSALMEPWDGPASIVFTDGHAIGAVLDRNGLRPMRYVVTGDGLLIAGSEAGMVTVDEANVKEKGALGPGQLLAVDIAEGRLYHDTEMKDMLAASQDFSAWVGKINELDDDLAKAVEKLQRMRAFGYTTETMQFMLKPMITDFIGRLRPSVRIFV